MGFNVISLDRAIAHLKNRDMPSHSLVLTVDDGWQGAQDIAMPLLAEQGFDWTLYLTSYYSQKQTQIMNVALRYICWKTELPTLDLSAIDATLQGTHVLSTLAEKKQAALVLIAFGHTLKTADARQAFVRHVATVLQVDQQKIEDKRMFYLINAASVADMAAAGVDIQLHSHRHDVDGLSEAAMLADIRENRDFITAATGGAPTVHFCYPSGVNETAHYKWLAGIGVTSATTCKAGLNYDDTEPMALNRFLDGENITEIEFEAEMSGFLELARRARAKIGFT